MPKGVRYGGRRRGTPNRFTAQFRDALRIVYDEIGGHEAFAAWARENRGDFYRIMSKLLPAEVARPREESAALKVVLVNFELDTDGKVVERLPAAVEPALLTDENADRA